MISAEIQVDAEYCCIGSDGHHDCVHTIKFNDENLIIISEKEGKQLCYMLFDLTPDLIKELRAFVDILTLSQEIYDED